MRVPCARTTTDIFFSYIDRAPHRFEDIRYRVKTKDKGEVEIFTVSMAAFVLAKCSLSWVRPARKTCLIERIDDGDERRGELW